MVQREIAQLVDDLTGETIGNGNGESISFGLDGHLYTINLSKENAEKFRAQVQAYIAVAAKVGR